MNPTEVKSANRNSTELNSSHLWLMLYRIAAPHCLAGSKTNLNLVKSTTTATTTAVINTKRKGSSLETWAIAGEKTAKSYRSTYNWSIVLLQFLSFFQIVAPFSFVLQGSWGWEGQDICSLPLKVTIKNEKCSHDWNSKSGEQKRVAATATTCHQWSTILA